VSARATEELLIPTTAGFNVANTNQRLGTHGNLLCLTPQISHARRAGEPSLLKYRAMLSGDIISESREFKGVALWLTGSALSSLLGLRREGT
jgi:hypothetical protein